MDLVRLWNSSQRDVISHDEFMVLASVADGIKTAAAMAADQEATSGKPPRLSSIHGNIASVQSKGLLRDEGKVGTGGRPARIYGLTPLGTRALEVGVRMALHIRGNALRGAVGKLA